MPVAQSVWQTDLHNILISKEDTSSSQLNELPGLFYWFSHKNWMLLSAYLSSNSNVKLYKQNFER